MLSPSVFYLLGWTIGCLAALMFVACIAAVGLGEWSQAGVLLVNACVSGFVSGALIIGLLNSARNLLDVSSYYQMIAKATVILLAVLVDRKSKQ